jgi:hypothetical protein
VCTLAVFLGVFPDMPLVVAANRDEFLTRPTAWPGTLRDESPRAFGGRDLIAEGTWLGVNEVGLIAGMLNRRTTAFLDPDCRSRGHSASTCSLPAPRAAAVAANKPPSATILQPAGCGRVRWQRHRSRQAAARAPRPGLHLLRRPRRQRPRCPRIAASQQAAAAGDGFTRDRDRAAFVTRLAAVLADHTTPLDPRGPGGLCVHGDGYGTRSSTVILVGRDGDVLGYHHADGPPCRTPLEPVALPF